MCLLQLTWTIFFTLLDWEFLICCGTMWKLKHDFCHAALSSSFTCRSAISHREAKIYIYLYKMNIIILLFLHFFNLQAERKNIIRVVGDLASNWMDAIGEFISIIYYPRAIKDRSEQKIYSINKRKKISKINLNKLMLISFNTTKIN